MVHMTSMMVVLPFYYIFGRSLLYTHILSRGSLVIDNRFAYPTTVVDTSVGGLGLRSCPPLTVDDVICVKFADIGEFHCRVAWFRDNRCGVEFVDGIDPEDIDALCRLIKQNAK